MSVGRGLTLNSVFTFKVIIQNNGLPICFRSFQKLSSSLVLYSTNFRHFIAMIGKKKSCQKTRMVGWGMAVALHYSAWILLKMRINVHKKILNRIKMYNCILLLALPSINHIQPHEPCTQGHTSAPPR